MRDIYFFFTGSTDNVACNTNVVKNLMSIQLLNYCRYFVVGKLNVVHFQFGYVWKMVLG